MPLNRTTQSGLPTCFIGKSFSAYMNSNHFIELGWTLYDNQAPEDLELQLTNLVESNRHPIWNQQFYVYNPMGLTHKEGFFYLCIRDRNVPDALDKIYIPLNPMKPFQPYNFVRSTIDSGWTDLL